MVWKGQKLESRYQQLFDIHWPHVTYEVPQVTDIVVMIPAVSANDLNEIRIRLNFFHVDLKLFFRFNVQVPMLISLSEVQLTKL